ncbi:MAG: hypothetical protein B7733_15160 [Myxococcales bacterium FL481]|nr:MAG: hypothetical protein B7733_15160 [Myxococcales bacterium FL481]
MSYVRGEYGVPIPEDSEVARGFPLRALVECRVALTWFFTEDGDDERKPPHQVRVAGYSTSAYDGVTGLWVMRPEDDFGQNAPLARVRLEDVLRMASE